MGSIPAAFIVVAALTGMANSLWMTLFPVFLDAVGFQLWEVGLASSLLNALIFMTALPAGLLADRVSVRVMLASSTIAQALLLYMIRSVNAMPLLVLGLIAYSFSQSLGNQSGIRLVTAATGPERRGLVYSIYMLVGGVAGIAGSYLSGYIVERYGYFQLFQLAIALLLLASAASLAIRHARTGTRPKRVLAEYMARREYLLLVAAISVHDFAVFASGAYVSLFQKKVVGVSEYEIGLLVAIQNSLMQATQVVAGYLTDRVGGVAVLTTHFLGVSLAYYLVGVSGSFQDLLLASLVQGFFFAFDMPARRKLLSMIAPVEVFGAINGLADTVVGFAILPSPFIGSYIWTAFSPRLLMSYSALVNLAAVAPLLLLGKRLES